MKHQELLTQMTLEEKAAILSGKTVWQTREVERLGIPAIFLSDGPHGIRKQAGTGDHLGLNASLPATCFPTAATIANSWNEELGEEIGRALGEEAASQRVNVLLGPGLNIKRSPLCGRNFEYFSEDPYLAGKMAASYIRGIQSQGIYACPKHFAVNSQELRRMAMNAVIDERTLREIYLTGFEIAVKEGNARSIMTSYNEINGVYANENKHLLHDILRKEWGFDGFVVTDWGASNDHAKGIAAGSNLEMPAPGLDSARELLKAIDEGNLTVGELDRCVDELLDAVLTLNKNMEGKPKYFNEKAHHDLARKAALESAVLLKNEDKILPLRSKTKVAIVGDFAVRPRYQGAGSSMVNPTFVESIEKVADQYDLQVIGVNEGYRRSGEKDEAMKKATLDLVINAEVVLYFFGLDEISESEGLDRTHMRIPQNQIELLEAIVQVNPNVVGIISAGSSVEMPWHYSLKAILHGYLNGQAGAGAILDILTGKVNPSGRLNETYPVKHEDTPAFRHYPSTERNSEYRESIFVGYRYYDTSKVRVQYPFGYGLSYTTFDYSDLEINEKEVKFTLTNSGTADGAEVAQLYVGLPNGKVFRPAKELKGFKKVFLRACESIRISIPFDDKTFRYWNVKTNQWEIEGGEYELMVGACVADIRLVGTIHRDGTTDDFPYSKKQMPLYYSGLIQKVEDGEFACLLGYSPASGKWSGDLDINDAICQMYYAKSPVARMIYNRLTAMKKKSEDRGKPDLNILFIYNMPFRAIAKMTGGAVSMDMVRGMVKVVNGHFFKGIKQIVAGYFTNSRLNRAYEKKLKGK
ncbi:beta-glucosidase [Eubacterium sp. 14-2]|uniref:glycoside hydrolase family 3 C-terminal domain-containing protein n=1 Tax=Eubacterium sp. 14-2 TaxID=1235790 RepID=UPI00033C868B|nr:glycoside hydrolase family 3 C-terminal domain-containing protein [Eubacterium sp. 14-2]EOT21606.1 beta-glucosidase [Eubacterium sp. 14-2]